MDQNKGIFSDEEDEEDEATLTHSINMQLSVSLSIPESSELAIKIIFGEQPFSKYLVSSGFGEIGGVEKDFIGNEENFAESFPPSFLAIN